MGNTKVYDTNTQRLFPWVVLAFKEIFLSPDGRCVVYPVGVQLRLVPFIEFWIRKGILDFKTCLLERPFFASKCFIPRREMRSISSRGPIDFGLGKVYSILKHASWRGLFFASKCFIVMGRMGRSSKVSLNFFHLRYIKYYTDI